MVEAGFNFLDLPPPAPDLSLPSAAPGPLCAQVQEGRWSGWRPCDGEAPFQAGATSSDGARPEQPPPPTYAPSGQRRRRRRRVEGAGGGYSKKTGGTKLLREVGEAGFNLFDFPPPAPDLSLPTAAPGPLFAQVRARRRSGWRPCDGEAPFQAGATSPVGARPEQPPPPTYAPSGQRRRRRRRVEGAGGGKSKRMNPDSPTCRSRLSPRVFLDLPPPAPDLSEPSAPPVPLGAQVSAGQWSGLRPLRQMGAGSSRRRRFR